MEGYDELISSLTPRQESDAVSIHQNTVGIVCPACEEQFTRTGLRDGYLYGHPRRESAFVYAQALSQPTCTAKTTFSQPSTMTWSGLPASVHSWVSDGPSATSISTV